MNTAELRRLLELAAKAAGIDYRPAIGCRVIGTGATGVPIMERWNPAEDDGDSRRLEVALRMVVNCSYKDFAVVRLNGLPGECREPWGDDRNATTRLAVLRAAAAIGEDMP